MRAKPLTAENYYTADYPDDEVASDDEYDRDAYHFRTENASDLEEFEDGDDSGDEGQGVGRDAAGADGDGFRITIGNAARV